MCRAAVSGRQVLGVSWGDLHDLGASFSALNINDRDGVSSLVITNTPGARPLLPLGAKCIALDRPFAVHHASKRPLIQGRTIRVPVDHTVPDLPGCRHRGGFQVGGIARNRRLYVGSCHLGSKRRADQANEASRNDDSMRSNTHGSCVSMKKDFVTAAD